MKAKTVALVRGSASMPQIKTVIITTIPHTKQRYDTCGDWQFASDGTLMIRVSEMSDWKRSLLVARHELDEAFLCTARGITEKQVDNYDLGQLAHEGQPDSGLGNVFNSDSPYCMEHYFATAAEMTLAQQLKIDWEDYENELDRMEWRPNGK